MLFSSPMYATIQTDRPLKTNTKGDNHGEDVDLLLHAYGQHREDG